MQLCGSAVQLLFSSDLYAITVTQGISFYACAKSFFGLLSDLGIPYETAGGG